MDPLSFDPSTASADDINALEETLAAAKFYPRALGVGDGSFGPGCQRALLAYLVATAPTSDVVTVASTQIGVCENPDHQNDGPFVNLYQDDNGGEHGESWCADLVCWVVRRWLQNCPRAPKITPPMTRAAWGFTEWGLDHGAAVYRPGAAGFVPQRGDIVEYIFSHVGIVSDFADGTLHCIEGNTNSDGSADGYEVILHPRYLSKVRALIRLPQAA